MLTESPDGQFYEQPRFVTHIDDGAIDSIRDYYDYVMTPQADLLDLCSSWISHLPTELELGRVAGLGMNAEGSHVTGSSRSMSCRTLTKSPRCHTHDESFDHACNVVSIDYLNKPLQIFQEVHRVLRPGGKAIMSFSNLVLPNQGHCHVGLNRRLRAYLDRGLLLQVLSRLVRDQGVRPILRPWRPLCSLCTK